MKKVYLCIDLKSFYASVECIQRGLDPLTTNLVVANEERTEKTICLAVTPSLKAFGISGRARLYEVIASVDAVNRERKRYAKNNTFSKKSYDAIEIKNDKSVELSYIVAKPRMALYMEYSAKIYDVYLKYVSHEDILTYSIDEVFIDITPYLATGKISPHDFATKIIRDVLKTTGITATAGIGENMYLAKIAMDITAKKMEPDEFGVRIAELDTMSYRRELWCHRPLTDFWRIGEGTAKKLEKNMMYTLGDVARMSSYPEGRKRLKKLFGINAKLLVDHAWGYEPTTIKEAKSYTPMSKSISSGQVLKEPYDFIKTRVIVWEMLELLSLDLVEKGLLTDKIVLTIGYDVENLKDPLIRDFYEGEVTTDRYGRKTPKHAHGTANLEKPTSSAKMIEEACLELYDKIVDKNLLVRRVTIGACNLTLETEAENKNRFEQIDLFSDLEKTQKEEALKKERKIQETIIGIKRKFGKNAILKGTNLTKGATTKERNNSIGGHEA